MLIFSQPASQLLSARSVNPLHPQALSLTQTKLNHPIHHVLSTSLLVSSPLILPSSYLVSFLHVTRIEASVPSLWIYSIPSIYSPHTKKQTETDRNKTTY